MSWILSCGLCLVQVLAAYGGRSTISQIDQCFRPEINASERKCRMRRVERPDAILSDIQGLSFGRSRVFGEVKSKAADERSKAMNFCA